ncbi:MAG: ABC transporter ATP-binding protein [Blastocatellia bacterium]
MESHSTAATPLLDVRDLHVNFDTRYGLVKAVDGVSFRIEAGETLGLVGESGCGKSVTAFSILRLVPSPHGIYAGGQVLFSGVDLLRLNEQKLNSVRGNQISIVFQEPMSSLNPILTVGDQIAEAIFSHRPISKREAHRLTLDMLSRVEITSPESCFNAYPHQLSGGMLQRAMIAMALMCGPKLLLADEPTTALDVTIQAQILDLLEDLRRELNMALLLITHDLGVVAQTCDRVAVMYAGKIVEYSDSAALFEMPRHPYTRGLFSALPTLSGLQTRLRVIPGNVPSPLDYPSGCRFRPRCPIAKEICETEPDLREIDPGHLSACHFAESIDTIYPAD